MLTKTVNLIFLSLLQTFNLEKVVPLECCRLVSYDSAKDSIECSLEGKEGELLSDLLQNYKNEFLLEIRKEGEEFEVYKPGSK